MNEYDDIVNILYQYYTYLPVHLYLSYLSQV